MDDRHQDFDQCRLACAIGAEQAEDLSWIDGHRHAAKGMHLSPEGLMDVLDCDCCLHVVADGTPIEVLAGELTILRSMARRCRTLGSFVDELEQAGELRRVSHAVSPLLEASAMAVEESRREAASAGTGVLDSEGAMLGGHAIRFDNIEGCDFPLVMNVFGSYARVERALRCHAGGLESLAAKLEAITRLEPPTGILSLLSRGRSLLPLLKAPPRRVRRGICQEVVRLTDRNEVDLCRLPITKSWPLDGDPAAVGWPQDAETAGTAGGEGRFITFAGMHTIHARDRNNPRPPSHNIGMYRAQLLGPTTLAMHWHVHHDGAAHWRSWKEIGQPMPIAICFGGEPVLPYAATAPLPPGISELLMAGFLEGRGIAMVQAKTVPLRVPANSEIVIEGWVNTDAGACGWMPGDEPIGPGAVLEGPFGDHTGYYSLPDRYPIVEVTAMTHRTEAVFLSTVVGPPPQEDYWLGKATERVFLPLLKTLIPDLVDYDLPMAGCFHNWAVLGIRKAYALQARRIMHAVWGAGQMAWTKCVLVVDADEVDVHDQDAVLRALFTHVDFARDVECTFGPLDILDHAAAQRGAGGKIGFDATPRWKGEDAGTGASDQPPAEDIDAVRAITCGDDVDVPTWGCGRCIVSRGELPAIPSGWSGLHVRLDSDVDIRNKLHVWFHMLASMDPQRDVRVAEDAMTIDARTIGKPDTRDWPPFLGWT